MTTGHDAVVVAFPQHKITHNSMNIQKIGTFCFYTYKTNHNRTQNKWVCTWFLSHSRVKSYSCRWVGLTRHYNEYWKSFYSIQSIDRLPWVNDMKGKGIESQSLHVKISFDDSNLLRSLRWISFWYLVCNVSPIPGLLNYLRQSSVTSRTRTPLAFCKWIRNSFSGPPDLRCVN